MRKTVFAVAALSLASFTSTSAQNHNGRGTATANLVKDCQVTITNNYPAWGYCVITASNISQIPANTSKLYYEQSQAQLFETGVGGAPFIDSNVLLDAGEGNITRGRCTFVLSPNPVGLCQFTDGIGTLAGFEGRFVVAPVEGTSYDFSLIGPYQFTKVDNE